MLITHFYSMLAMLKFIRLKIMKKIHTFPNSMANKNGFDILSILKNIRYGTVRMHVLLKLLYLIFLGFYHLLPCIFLEQKTKIVCWIENFTFFLGYMIVKYIYRNKKIFGICIYFIFTLHQIFINAFSLSILYQYSIICYYVHIIHFTYFPIYR